jgi:hypothetical protein
MCYVALRVRAELLRPLFDNGDDEDMALGYPITEELWPQVRAILRCGPPDPDQEYFLGAFISGREHRLES